MNIVWLSWQWIACIFTGATTIHTKQPSALKCIECNSKKTREVTTKMRMNWKDNGKEHKNWAYTVCVKYEVCALERLEKCETFIYYITLMILWKWRVLVVLYLVETLNVTQPENQFERKVIVYAVDVVVVVEELLNMTILLWYNKLLFRGRWKRETG